MKEETGAATPLHHEHDEEIRRLKDFAQAYGKTIVTAVCVAVIGISALKIYRYHKRSTREEASRLFVQARSAADLQDLMSRYSSSPAAPLSLLKLAKVDYDTGKYASARSHYEEFATKYPEHGLIAAAAAGQVFCAEASGNWQGALEGYRNFRRKYPDHFLTPQALLGEGRCLQKLGMKEEARTVYEDFIAANPDSPWAGNAEEALELLDKDAYTREDLQPGRPDEWLALPLPETAPPPIMSPVEVLPAAPPGE